MSSKVSADPVLMSARFHNRKSSLELPTLTERNREGSSDDTDGGTSGIDRKSSLIPPEERSRSMSVTPKSPFKSHTKHSSSRDRPSGRSSSSVHHMTTMGGRGRRRQGSYIPTLVKRLESTTENDDFFEFDDQWDAPWFKKKWARVFYIVSYLLSTVSVACNSPKTFEDVPGLRYATLAVDVVLAFPFGLLIVSELRYRGLWKRKSRSRPFLKNLWCWADSVVYTSVLGSIALQIMEIIESLSDDEVYYANDARSLVRLPRALTVLLVFRFGKFKRPSKHTIMILKRAAKQIRNAAILFAYIIFLFALVGIQLFGPMSDHCVENSFSNETSVSYSSITPGNLAIPDTLCSSNRNNQGYINNYGHAIDSGPCQDHDTKSELLCPNNYSCKHINADKQEKILGDFRSLYAALLSVYDSSTQELWTFLMYNASDFAGWYAGTIYFVLLIILVGWLAENVFIVVVIEAFADFRSRLFEHYAPSAPVCTQTLVLRKYSDNDRGWTLESLADPVKLDNPLKRFFISSREYHWCVVFLVLLDAVLMACRVVSDQPGLRDEVLFPIQISFTVIFLVEVVLKIWVHGRKRYFSQRSTRFEFIIALGSVANVIQWGIVGHDEPHYLAVFQVLRMFRLVRASNAIHQFVNQIIGNGKRLGMLLFATLLFLFIIGIVSLQAFCHFKNVTAFATFPVAFMSTFRIIIQEGWVELTSDVMNQTPAYVAYTASFGFFLLLHLVGSLIIFSMFVAVIADNLELPEDKKLDEQERQSRMITKGDEELPWRLKIFEHFPNDPKLVHVPNTSNYDLPPIRESVMRNFIESGEKMRNEWRSRYTDPLPQSNADVPVPRRDTHFQLFTSLTTERQNLMRKRSSIASIIRESNRSRFPSGQSEIVETVSHRRIAPMAAQNRRLTTPKIEIIGQPIRRKTLRRSKDKTITDHVQQDLAKSKSKPEVDFNEQKTIHFRMRRSQEESKRKMETKEEELKGNHRYLDSALFLFGPDNPVRKFCQRIVDARYEYKPNTEVVESVVPVWLNKSFSETLKSIASQLTYLDWIMLFIALVTSVIMCLESPHNTTSDCLILYVSDILFVAANSIELLLKIMAHGFIFAPKAFVRDIGNIFDIFVFVVSLVYLIIQPDNKTTGGEVLLVFRCLRPLRVISLSPSLRKTISEMFVIKSVGTKKKSQYGLDILYVTVLMVMFIFMWASYGLQLFAGKLEHCNDVCKTNQSECVGYFDMSISVKSWLIFKNKANTYPKMLVPRVWSNPGNFNFDTIGTAFLTLFEVITLEGWLLVRDVLNERLGWLTQVFLFSYIFLGILVVLTLFVGVILSNFQKNKGTALLTVDQRRWCDLKKRLQLLQPLTLPPRPENSPWRSWLYDKLQTRTYKWTSVFLIVLHSLTLAIPWKSLGVHSKANEDIKSTQDGLMIAGSLFILVFVAEIIIKMLAFTVQGFFMSKRNICEFGITVMGLAYFVSAMVSISTDRWNVTRVLGIIAIMTRTGLLVGKIESLKMLMMTLVVTLLKSFYVFAALALILITYALIGVVLFHDVRWGEGINRYANFQSTGHAWLLMFRIMTGEDWNKIMHDCMVQPPECHPGRCGNVWASVVFFCSFYVLVSFIILNVLIAVMVENFSLFYSSEEAALLSHHDLKGFLAKWNIIDRERKGAIPAKHVKFLLRLLDGRMEIHDKLVFQNVCREIEKFCHDEKSVGFQKVISMLAFWYVEIKECLMIDEYLARKELEDTIRYEVAQQTIQCWLKRSFRAIKEHEAAAQSRASPAFSLNPIKQPDAQKYNQEIRVTGGDSDSSSGENEEIIGRARALSTETVQSHSLISKSQKGTRFADRRDSSKSEDSLRGRRLHRSRSPADGTVMAAGLRVSVQSEEDLTPLLLGTKVMTDEICDWFNKQAENASEDSDF